MKTTVLTAAMVLAMPAFAFAQDKCYDDAKNQGDLNECADAAFKKSDKKLNELYKQIEARLKDDADTRKLLVQAQRDWVKFRDAECSFQTAEAAGGSMMLMLVAQCMDILTQSRIKNFQGYLNCEEGDMSCPVPAAAAPVAAAPAAAVPAAAIPAAAIPAAAVLAAAVLADAIPAAAAAPAAAVPAPARGEMASTLTSRSPRKLPPSLRLKRRGSLPSPPISAIRSRAPRSTATKSVKSAFHRRTKTWRSLAQADTLTSAAQRSICRRSSGSRAMLRSTSTSRRRARAIRPIFLTAISSKVQLPMSGRMRRLRSTVT